MLGRFVAYKAMNAVWRSAARRGGSGGASSASPTETVRLVLAIVSYAGVFCGGMASCLAGGTVMLSLGLVLAWIVGPAVLIGIMSLPERWFDARRPLSEGFEETQGRRATAQMIGVPIVMLLGAGTCVSGQPTLGTVVALAGSCLLFVALVYAPVRWFGYSGFASRMSRAKSSEKGSIKQVSVGERTRPPDSVRCWQYDGPCVQHRGCPAFFSNQDACYWDFAEPGITPPTPYYTVQDALGHYEASRIRREEERLAELESKREAERAELRPATERRQEQHAKIPVLADTRVYEPNQTQQVDDATSTQPNQPPAVRPYVVYFIQEKKEGGHFKVGVTYSLQRRLRELQTGNPNELEVAHTLEVGTRDVAERIEEAVLAAVKGAGAELKGEWFENDIVPWALEVANRERLRDNSIG